MVIGNSDGVALMSYRDTAAAMLAISAEEIALAKKFNTRIVLGAETGETGEGDFVSFFEEGAGVLRSELAAVRRGLESEGISGGCGVAIHHLGSWEKLSSSAPEKSK